MAVSLMRLGSAFVIVLLATILLYLYADQEIAIYFANLDTTHPLKRFFFFMTDFGKSEWFLVPSLLLFAWFRYKKRATYATMALYIFVVNVVAGLAVWLLKIPFGRMRPKLLIEENLYGFQWFETTSKFVSFPSGHTITAISSAVALSLLFPKYKYVFLAFGGVVAISRVVTTAHFLSDVLFATFMGTVVALLLYKHYFKESNNAL